MRVPRVWRTTARPSERMPVSPPRAGTTSAGRASCSCRCPQCASARGGRGRCCARSVTRSLALPPRRRGGAAGLPCNYSGVRILEAGAADGAAASAGTETEKEKEAVKEKGKEAVKEKEAEEVKEKEAEAEKEKRKEKEVEKEKGKAKGALERAAAALHAAMEQPRCAVVKHGRARRRSRRRWRPRS